MVYRANVVLANLGNKILTIEAFHFILTNQDDISNIIKNVTRDIVIDLPAIFYTINPK